MKRTVATVACRFCQATTGFWVALGVSSVALASAASLAVAAPSSSYPNSIAVLGHSGATGYDSDPARPRVDVGANSWATGTNPTVNSLYQRLLALNPRIKGHNLNLAQDGARVGTLLKQAQRAAKLIPRPEFVVVQILDNDIRCDGSVEPTPMFQATLETALGVLTAGAPKTRVFVVSQFGSPKTYVGALTATQRVRAGGGSGPCDIIDAAGKLIPKRVSYLEHVIHGYEAALAAGCKHIPNCYYDGGAFGRAVDRPEYISEDTNHFSIRGHAKAAAVAWAAMKESGIFAAG